MSSAVQWGTPPFSASAAIGFLSAVLVVI